LGRTVPSSSRLPPTLKGRVLHLWPPAPLPRWRTDGGAVRHGRPPAAAALRAAQHSPRGSLVRGAISGPVACGQTSLRTAANTWPRPVSGNKGRRRRVSPEAAARERARHQAKRNEEQVVQSWTELVLDSTLRSDFRWTASGCGTLACTVHEEEEENEERVCANTYQSIGLSVRSVRIFYFLILLLYFQLGLMQCHLSQDRCQRPIGLFAVSG